MLLFPPVQKHTKHSTKTKPWKDNEQTWWFHETKQEIFKKSSQMVSQKVTLFYEISRWRLYWHLWRPRSFFLLKKWSQSAPKVVPRLQKWLQKGSQSGWSGSQVMDKLCNMTAACAVFLIDFTVFTCAKTNKKLNTHNNENTCWSHVKTKNVWKKDAASSADCAKRLNKNTNDAILPTCLDSFYQSIFHMFYGFYTANWR